jgi:segregation and condensation protein B
MYSRKVMKSALESMMFMWGDALSVKDAADVLESDKKTVRELFEELRTEYELEGRGIRIRKVGDAYQFVTYIENEMFIEKLCTPVKVRKLSQAALEVLAIIAYRQPVTRGVVDSIRGIKSERVIDGLINKGLVEERGRSDAVGRPLLYGTTDEFLKKFGFESIKDLPDIEEFDDYAHEERGEAGPHEQISLDLSQAADDGIDDSAADGDGEDEDK